MNDKTLNPTESLELIGRMIDNTRRRLIHNSGRPFLIWGYTTIVVAAAVWIALWKTANPNWNFLWAAIPVLGSVTMWLNRKKSPGEGYAYTYLDRVIGIIWLVTGSATLLVSLLSLFGLIQLPILFVILLMMGIGSTTTCLLIRFPTGTVGGIVGILLAPLTLVVTAECSLGLFIAGFVVMMIVPGHVLNWKSGHQK